MKTRTALALGLLLISPAAARAALGGARDSVGEDRRALGGESRPPTVSPSFTVEPFELHGTTVREYVGTDGKVFAITWEGLTHPDLSTLLGAHAAPWLAARDAAPRSASRSHRRLGAGAVIVETWGHMRHLRGRAFLPQSLPPGVTEHDLQ